MMNFVFKMVHFAARLRTAFESSMDGREICDSEFGFFLHLDSEWPRDLPTRGLRRVKSYEVWWWCRLRRARA